MAPEVLVRFFCAPHRRSSCHVRVNGPFFGPTRFVFAWTAAAPPRTPFSLHSLPVRNPMVLPGSGRVLPSGTCVHLNAGGKCYLQFTGSRRAKIRSAICSLGGIACRHFDLGGRVVTRPMLSSSFQIWARKSWPLYSLKINFIDLWTSVDSTELVVMLVRTWTA